MEGHNNEIGYRVARDHPNASNKEIARLAQQELDRGHTLSIRNGDKIEFSDGVPRRD